MSLAELDEDTLLLIGRWAASEVRTLCALFQTCRATRHSPLSVLVAEVRATLAICQRAKERVTTVSIQSAPVLSFSCESLASTLRWQQLSVLLTSNLAPQLLELTLSQMTDDGLRSLLDAVRPSMAVPAFARSQLSMLTVTGNQEMVRGGIRTYYSTGGIGDAGIESLAEAMEAGAFTNLRRLCLDGNPGITTLLPLRQALCDARLTAHIESVSCVSAHLSAAPSKELEAALEASKRLQCFSQVDAGVQIYFRSPRTVA